MNLFSFFFPKKITEAYSPINGEIEVVEQFGKKSIRVEGLEQSGPMVEKIWKKGIKKITNYQLLITEVLHFCLLRGGPERSRRGLLGGESLQKCKTSTTTNVLILGLGAGSVINAINKHFPKARILGIEIDPMMIELGKKYLNLSECKNLEIKIADAFKWVQKSGDSNHQTIFDLILIDLYLGRKVPEKMESEKFLSAIKELLTNKGIVIFNFLRTKEKKIEFQEFLNKLKKSYPHIKVIKPLVNYLVICQN